MRRLIPLLLLFATAAQATDLTSCGNITTAGSYTLQSDVSANGTCYYVTANGVTIDLNGHTVTYDNAAPITVANGSFESSDMSAWDLTGAPAAVRAAGTYLGRTVYAGSYALKIPAPTTADQSIVTAGSYTLTGGVSYSASVMMWQPYNIGVSGNSDIHMTIEILSAADNSVLATRDSRELQASYTTRGFQYVRALYTPSVDTAVKVRLKVTGGRTVTNSGQTPYGAFYFDDVRIQQTNHQGVKFGMTSPEGTAWGRYGTVKNGKIVQGQAHGDFSDAVKVAGILASDVNSYTVDGLEITVSGNSSKAVWANQAANGVISNNLIHGLTDTIEIRDHYDGALIYVARADSATGAAGKIFGNTIDHGIQTGIYVAGSPSASMLTEIYGNTITLQSKYTNDFGIVGGYGAYSANVHNNTVQCTGGNSCRGIFIHGNNGIIANNTVDVHYLKNNQEYGLEFGGCGGSSYGIQVDISSSNVETSGNTVTARADDCEASAFRFYAQPAGTTTNNLVHGNTFTALSAGTALAETLRILETVPSDLTFYGNTLISNSAFLHHDGNVSEGVSGAGLTLDGNTFQISYPKSALYYPLVDNAYSDLTAYVPVNVHITNNTYADSTVRSDMQAAVFRNQRTSYTVTDTTGLLITESGTYTPSTRSLNGRLSGRIR